MSELLNSIYEFLEPLFTFLKNGISDPTKNIIDGTLIKLNVSYNELEYVFTFVIFIILIVLVINYIRKLIGIFTFK